MLKVPSVASTGFTDEIVLHWSHCMPERSVSVFHVLSEKETPSISQAVCDVQGRSFSVGSTSLNHALPVNIPSRDGLCPCRLVQVPHRTSFATTSQDTEEIWALNSISFLDHPVSIPSVPSDMDNYIVRHIQCPDWNSIRERRRLG